MMSVPTQGEEYAKLIEFLRQAQESAYTLSHLTRAMSGSTKDNALADGWFAVGELMKRMQYQVTQLAQGHLQ